jgi:2-methylcitrate dehydratase
MVESICSFLEDLRYNRLSDDVISAAKRVLVDTLGCAIGGYSSDPAKIAIAAARGVQPRPPTAGATVLIEGVHTSPELAAFANGVMIRVLDYNDYYHAPLGGGHPSDYVAAVLAAAEASGADTKVVLAGIVAAYEIYCRYVEAGGLGGGSWDQVVPGVLAAGGAASFVMGLGRDRTAHAISLSIVPNLAIQETRLGEVSMWKGCAAANASRNGVFAASLAALGVTGPAMPFEGRGGVFAGAVARFEPPLLGDNGIFAISSCQFKQFPVGSLSQTAVTVIRSLRERVSDLREVESVVILTSREAIRVMAGDSEKWHPGTRESADHSLPFVAAATLLNGAPTVADFEQEIFRDLEVLSLIAKVVVREDEECNSAFPGATMVKVQIVMRNGESFDGSLMHHRGHYLNPMSDSELEAKFYEQAAPVLGHARALEVLTLARNIDELDSINMIFEAVRPAGA